MDELTTLSLAGLGYQIRTHREHLGLTQDALVKMCGNNTNRSNVSYLEQGVRLPDPEILSAICDNVRLPKSIWEPYLNPKVNGRLKFETLLQELSGSHVSGMGLDLKVRNVIEEEIASLFKGTLSIDHFLFQLNSIIVFYGVKPISKKFFDRFVKKNRASLESFEKAISSFQTDAIRLFSSLHDAYQQLNTDDEDEFDRILSPIFPRETDSYTARTDWTKIERIPNRDLPNLGYIAASRVKQESAERLELSRFLLEVADKKKRNEFKVDEPSIKTRRRMDSLLRKFNSTIEHGLFSPLFNPDIETLEKEADYISPKNDENLALMEETQSKAYRNLANYLTADYLDVYVATSMRNNADFISVNDFVESLFAEEDLKNLKLRYFNPTQSWIEDRVAKGLVEALMLKRAKLCIYMAQKEDTFGKDSEASVTLGQGKPVIVFVPKLYDADSGIDSEVFGQLDRAAMVARIKSHSNDDIDDAEDMEALQSRLLTIELDGLDLEGLIRIVKRHWADFDLESEFSKRIVPGPDSQASWEECDIDRNEIKKWFGQIIENDDSIELDPRLQTILKRILVAVSIQFEKRAKIFKEVHPLALQVILTTGVLNGIIVVRSVQMCSVILKGIMENRLELELLSDEMNYKLIEKNTKSMMRVISKHRLIANSFKTFYRDENS